MMTNSDTTLRDMRSGELTTSLQIGTPEASLAQLERQLERGSLFTHTRLSENSIRLGEIESFTYGLIDTLINKGLVSPDEVSASVASVREQITSNGENVSAGVALRVDEARQEQTPPTLVDCSARMHICHSVCCKLDFALSAPEIESGELKWDLGRPYFIRHEADGLCTHNNRSTGGCGVYSNRPSICRNYSCAHDERIWKDFEKMELNHEWLEQNFSESKPRALRILMQPINPVPVARDNSIGNSSTSKNAIQR